jgi:hypothetical protein
LDFSDRKRKFRLDSIQATETGDFGVNDFFYGKSLFKVLFFLKLTEIVDMNPKRILIFDEAKNIFFKVFGMFVFLVF